MKYETYSTMKPNGLVEVGFTFKDEASPEDALFDLVLDTLNPKRDDDIQDTCRDIWKRHEWAAKAICLMAPGSEVHVIAIGNPFDGLSLHGPFAPAEAAAWGDGVVDSDWWAANVRRPEEEEAS